MSTTEASEWRSPDRERARPHLRDAVGQLVGALPRPDLVVLAALLWAGAFLAVAVKPGQGLNDPTPWADLLMVPAGVILVVLTLGLARDQRLSKRDSLPWRLAGVGGVLTTGSALLLFAAHVRLPLVPVELAELTTLSPLLAFIPAALLFRPDRGPARPRLQYTFDRIALGLASAIALWCFVFEPLSSISGAGSTAHASCIVLVVGAVGFLARPALRPTIGMSSRTGMVLTLGIISATMGTAVCYEIGISPLSASAAELSMAGLQAAIIIGCRFESRARREGRNEGHNQGPSAIFYASVAAGSVPLGLLVLSLGSRYITIAASSLALSGLVAVRQYFSARDAVSADRARRKTEARFGWLVRNSSDFIMAVNAAGALDYVSPSVEQLLRVPADNLLGMPLTCLAHPEDVEALRDLVGRAMAIPGQRVSGEWRMKLADETWLPVETVASSGSSDLETRGVVLNTRDLRERKALEDKLTFQAFHDPLTRLANRNLFRERVQHALDRRSVAEVAVMFIDLDNFKTINDSLGHAAGDHVLIETAHRIRSALRTEDTAARLGGDEFAVLLEDTDETSAARVAERIRSALGTPFWVLGQEALISASIGIAIGGEGVVAGELLRNADVAMYTAKAKGKACFEIFEPKMHDAAVARLGMEAELRRAIERQEFIVHYQPIVRLETGEIIGAEALVRWQHPTRGLLPPLEFIPLAEETGLIIPLGGWILLQACMQLAEWQKLRRGAEPFVMNVNLSSRQLVRDAMADEIAAAVDQSGIRASWLVLEVTETVLMADPAAAAIALKHIRDLGVRIALDDFGSGDSSLSHLRRFPIDIVKIDKSFVDDVAHNGRESAIARGIIELGRALNIQTVAEGIEAPDQAETLRTLGCDLGQGYFFARPISADEWAGMLRSRAGWDQPAAMTPAVEPAPSQSAAHDDPAPAPIKRARKSKRAA